MTYFRWLPNSKKFPGNDVLSIFAIFLLLISTPFLFWQPAAAAETEFKLAHMFPRGSLPDQVAQRFSKLVSEKSDGRLKVTIYPAGYFGDERKNMSLLTRGALDFAVTGDLIVSYLGKSYLVISMPFLYRDPQHALSAYDSKLGGKMRSELRKKHGLEALSWYYVGTRVLTANRPIRNLKDLAGLNLRLPPDRVWTMTWRSLGVRPKAIQFTDLYAALERGRVEAQENPPNFIRAQKLYKVQKYIMTTNHMPQRQFLMASAKRYRSMPAADRSTIHESARAVARWTTAAAIEGHEKDLRWLVEQGGMTLIPFDKDGIEKLLAGVPPRIDGENGVKTYNYIKAAR